MTAANYLSLFWRGFFQTGDMFFGDDQYVRRTLRIQIFKSKSVVVFIDFL